MRNLIAYCLLLFTFISCSDSLEGELIFVKSNSNAGFNFPYYLFIPQEVQSNSSVYIIVEPNNSGFVDDDLQKHIDKAERTATKDFYLGNFTARKLKSPLLVPIFPRTESEWRIYTHALDRDVMLQTGTKVERLDLQLIAMFDDAAKKLKTKKINAENKMLLTGFSASGSFVNRFTLVNPEKVKAVAAGGVNGLLVFPLDSLNGVVLNYPLGTNDFDSLFHKPFIQENFKQIPQFYFMGENDDNDAIPYPDAYDDIERNKIYSLTGKNMMPERWNFVKDVYLNLNLNAKIKTYRNIGHEHPENVKDEIVQFFKESIK